MTVPPASSPGSSPPPTPQPEPRYRSSSEWAALALVAAGVVTAIHVSGAVLAFPAADAYDHLARTGGDAADIITAYGLFGVLRLVAFVFAYVATCLWMQRVRTNAVALRPQHPHRLRPGWVWGGWVCPIVDLWFPYWIVEDVHGATAVKRRTLVGWWWVAWLAVLFLDELPVLAVSGSGASDPSRIALLAPLEAVAATVCVVAFMAWLAVVRRVQRDQRRVATAAGPLDAAPPTKTDAEALGPASPNEPRKTAGLLVVLAAAGAVVTGVGIGLTVNAFVPDPPSDSSAQPDEDASGDNGTRPSGTKEVDIEALAVGDCFPSQGAKNGAVVRTIKLVPCSTPHDYEVFAVLDLPKGPYPGGKQVERLAATACLQRFKPFVGIGYRRSTLDFSFVYPLKASWPARRTVDCLVFGKGRTVGTLRGTRR